jgi:hypothetical protein
MDMVGKRFKWRMNSLNEGIKYREIYAVSEGRVYYHLHYYDGSVEPFYSTVMMFNREVIEGSIIIDGSEAQPEDKEEII